MVPSPRFLHVANGHATTSMFYEAGVPGRASIWADPLHEGPVPAGLSDDELLAVRAEHLGGGDPSRRQDAIEALREWRHAIDDRAAYDELVLWFEHDLFDQLNLIQLLDRIAASDVRSMTVSLICIGSFPGYPDFKGLGELTPAEIGSLLPTRARVADAQYELAERAWDAFRSSDPRYVEALVARDTSALPFLGAALRRYLQEFPWTTDGLSRCERRLLQLIALAPLALRAAFPRLHDGETAFYITDGSLHELAAGLVQAGLVAADPPLVPSESLPPSTLSLTALGHDILNGRADRIARCGIDRWLGGVHLEGNAAGWRWDDTLTRLTVV
jgi:hypothetical protein